MRSLSHASNRPVGAITVIALSFVFHAAIHAQASESMYRPIKAFELAGGKTEVNNFVLKRDRVEMTFDGTFYFSAPIDGKYTGAVFVGRGLFRAPLAPLEFEKANAKRLIGVDDVIESDFKTAVLRFSDDTADVIGKDRSEGNAPAEAQVFAAENDARILKETGVNLAARIVTSILHNEKPGFFFAAFDGGKRGRFSLVLDHQTRIPTNYFGINAGEKGLIFKYDSGEKSNDVWTAFHALEDYSRGSAAYADMFDLVDISHYEMRVDLSEPKKKLGLATKIRLQSLTAGLRAIHFTIGENLGEGDDERLNKQMRVKSAKLDATSLTVVQEDWESGFTVFLPRPVSAGQEIELEFEIAGDFLRQPTFRSNRDLALNSDCSYPRSNSNWYPRHGFLDRSTFDFTFTHNKKLKVASSGTRVSEAPDLSNVKELQLTKYSLMQPVPFVTFALGPWERHQETIKWENGDKPTPLEFNSLSGDFQKIKEDFILAELNNSVRYFQELFGKYPYDSYSAVFHPYGFGQGFATMLTIPPTDTDSKNTFSFIAHETAHQWWGNIISWRSYRDQWLSEGFAEYSGVVYTSLRDGSKSSRTLVDRMRNSLTRPPETQTGIGKGRLVDVGPLVLGHRLSTKKTYGAYSALVYNKGGLVLRMVHFLMTNPADGDGKAFYDMMKDFVARYRNKVASTDDFRIVAGEHFAKTPTAKKYGLKNLDWFFHQWVNGTVLPSYRLDYKIQPQADGTAVVTGNVIQENAPEEWFMPLPVVLKFDGGKYAYGTMAAKGAKTPFSLNLPVAPVSMELDPQRWVLSANTSTK